MKRPPHRMWLMAMAVVIGAPLTVARGEADVPVRPFVIQERGGQLFVRGNFRAKQEQSQRGGKVDESDQFLETGIDLNSRGYIYHPNLLDWLANFRIGISRQQIDINEESKTSLGRLLGFDLSGLVLKQKKLSARVFASASERFVDRDFTRSLKVDQTKYGVEFFTRGGFPMTLLIEALDYQEAGDVRSTDQQTRHLLFTLRDQRDPDRWFEIIFDREQTDETQTYTQGATTTVSDLPVTKNELSFASLLRWGAEAHKHRFGTRLRYLKREGFFTNEFLSANLELDLNHTETFTTFYHLNYSDDKTTTETERIINPEIGFIKRFYESLEMTGRVIYAARDFNAGRERMLGLFLNMNYRKKTPLGLYIAALMLGWQHDDEQNPSGTRAIRDESHTLNGITYEELAERNIIDGSVTVTNETRTIVYEQDTHYELRVTGAVTEIRRIAGAPGGILDGQTVLVHYSVTTSGVAVFTTRTVQWNNRLELKKWPIAVFFNYRRSEEQLVSGEDPGNLDTQTFYEVGAELDYKGLSIVVEHERSDQSLFPPSTTDRARVRYGQRLTREVDFSVGGQAQRTQYDNGEQFDLAPEDQQLDRLSAFANLTWKLRRNVLVRVTGDWQRTRGRENDELARIVAALEWKYRQLSLSVEARQSWFTQEQTEGAETALMFLMRRRF